MGRNRMEIFVYTLEDFRDDHKHGVIGVYDSFEKAKTGLIEVLKEEIMFCENELDEFENNLNVYANELHHSITKLKKMIKNVHKALPNSYYACGQLYITKHVLEQGKK